MRRVLVSFLALAMATFIGAIFALRFLSPVNEQSVGSSIGHSEYIHSRAEDVFAVVSDIDSWSDWQEDIFQVVRDDKNSDRVKITGLAGTVEYDIEVDPVNREVRLETVPASDMARGHVRIQVAVERRNHARLTVEEYVALKRDGNIFSTDEDHYRQFRNLAGSFSERQDRLIHVKSGRADDWDRLLGCWTTREESLAAGGAGWEPSRPAEWHFKRAFDGLGIQDTYTSPPPSVAVQDELSRQRGINLRIYNPNEDHWVATWLTTASTVPVNFIATPTDNTIVMEAATTNPQGFHNRITFFDITSERFEWKLELSKDQQEWTEAYRIHGKRGCEAASDPT